VRFRYRISIDLSVWTTYELLQVLHFILYMPLKFILFYFVVLCRNLVVYGVSGSKSYIKVGVFK